MLTTRSMQTKAPPLHIRDLLTGPSGRLSHTRVWSNLGSLAATAVFLKMGWAGAMTAEIFAVFLTGVCGHAALSKYLTLKHSTPTYPEVDRA